MVSTIRFRSLKNLDLTSPRSYKVLVPVAAWVALLSAYPEEVLVAMAYTYLVSPLIEWGVTRGLRRPTSPPAEPLPEPVPEPPMIDPPLF